MNSEYISDDEYDWMSCGYVSAVLQDANRNRRRVAYEGRGREVKGDIGSEVKNGMPYCFPNSEHDPIFTTINKSRKQKLRRVSYLQSL